MTDIRAAQRAYDNASPSDTYTYSFYATIGMADAEVLAFADVDEETGEVECINEVVYQGVDISAALTDEQDKDLKRQAAERLASKE
jgi:hypothetical protein